MNTRKFLDGVLLWFHYLTFEIFSCFYLALLHPRKRILFAVWQFSAKLCYSRHFHFVRDFAETTPLVNSQVLSIATGRDNQKC